MLYFTLLERNPDLGGLNFWLGIANNGGGGLLFQSGPQAINARVAISGTVTPNQGLIGSPEFQNRFQ